MIFRDEKRNFHLISHEIQEMSAPCNSLRVEWIAIKLTGQTCKPEYDSTGRIFCGYSKSSCMATLKLTTASTLLQILGSLSILSSKSLHWTFSLPTHWFAGWALHASSTLYHGCLQHPPQLHCVFSKSKILNSLKVCFK